MTIRGLNHITFARPDLPRAIAFYRDSLALTLAPTCARLTKAGARIWKANRSEGDSFCFTDPDGHRLELHVGSLASRLAHIAKQQVKAPQSW